MTAEVQTPPEIRAMYELARELLERAGRSREFGGVAPEAMAYMDASFRILELTCKLEERPAPEIPRLVRNWRENTTALYGVMQASAERSERAR